MQRSGALGRMNIANVAAKKVATKEDYALGLAQMTLIARDMILVSMKIIVGFSQRPTAPSDAMRAKKETKIAPTILILKPIKTGIAPSKTMVSLSTISVLPNLL